MKIRLFLIGVLTIFLASSLLGPTARAATITIQVLETFDYPGATQTYPNAINDSNQIAGFFSGGQVTRGFTRTADGQFSAPIIEPNDTHNLTAAYGINNLGTVCGSFWGADDVHSFLLSGGVFTQYDVPASLGHGTVALGINDADDLAGYYYTPENALKGFFTLDGEVTTLDIPGGNNIWAQKINNLNQTVGFYIDTAAGFSYGFFTSRNGTLKYPIAAPNSLTTYLAGINDRGWIVGKYYDHDRLAHGLFFIPPNQFVTFDYAGSPLVTLTGINHQGFICGYYLDGNVVHGLLARVRRSAE